MELPIKLIVCFGSIAFVCVLMKLFIFDAILKFGIKEQTALKKNSEMRSIYLKLPFPLNFKVYFFNVSNPMEVQNGEIPIVKEIGPYWYDEFKERVDVVDNDTEDSLSYTPYDIYQFNRKKSGNLSDEDYVTIIHPLLVGIVNQVTKEMPTLLTLVNKAIMEIFQNPNSIYLTAKVKDILFDGIEINCNVKDFSATAVCIQLKQKVPGLKVKAGEEKIFLFSLLGPRNGTSTKKFKILRGISNSKDLGRLVEIDGKKEVNLWSTQQCNRFNGTDGWIFPPLLKPEDGIWSYSPDLCRNVGAYPTSEVKLKNINLRRYEMDFGDMANNRAEKCYCYNNTCLKKGVLDLTRCLGTPILVTLPHFLKTDELYLTQVKGLEPDPEKHSLMLYFESMTGTPIEAAKRIQFNLEVQSNNKIDIMQSLPTSLHPLFWLEEGVSLEGDLLKKVQNLFLLITVVQYTLWILIIVSLGGLIFGIYQHMKNRKRFKITKVHDLKNGFQTNINTLTRTYRNEEKMGVDNPEMNGHEFDKY